MDRGPRAARTTITNQLDMTHITYALLLWALTFITTPAAAASPNHCEHIIVVVQEAADEGVLTPREANEIISRCSEELWG